MTQSLSQGDRVKWNTPQRDVREAHLGNRGRRAEDSRYEGDDPRYLIESEKSGSKAAHKPDSLTKASTPSR